MSLNPGQAARQTNLLIKNLQPLPAKKNPGIALLIGVFFGALGIGIYFRSWKDFFLCLFLFISFTIIFPAIGAIPGWLFSGVYGAYRAHTSNERIR
jgi:hypothetical protein